MITQLLSRLLKTMSCGAKAKVVTFVRVSAPIIDSKSTLVSARSSLLVDT
jgi:hypothetical protein